VSSCIVKPESDLQSATLCTYADWQSRHGTVSFAFCYRHRLDAERLRDALQQVLTDFPDYAGRLRMDRGALLIEHGRGGAAFEVAASSESYETLTATAQLGKDRVVCPPMSTRRTLSGRDPLLAVRLTETSDGCVLGVTWHHSVGDLASTMHLLDAWSKAYANAAYDAPPHLVDRVQYLDQHMPDPEGAVSAMRLISAGEVCSLLPFILRRKVRTDFEFSWDQLEQLQRWAARGGFVSVSDGLCAHAAAVLHELAPERPVKQLALAVNYRKRVGLPKNVQGNLISTITVDLTAASSDAARVATELRTRLNDYGSRHADYHATRRFLAEHPGSFARARVVPSLVDAKGGTWIVSNFTNYGVYDLAFDGATPALWCVLTDAPLPLMSVIFERPNRAGITLSMQLPEALAQRAASPEGRARMQRMPLTAQA